MERPVELWLAVVVGPAVALVALAGLVTVAQRLGNSGKYLRLFDGRALNVLIVLVLVLFEVAFFVGLVQMWQRSVFWGIFSTLAVAFLNGAPFWVRFQNRRRLGH